MRATSIAAALCLATTSAASAQAYVGPTEVFEVVQGQSTTRNPDGYVMAVVMWRGPKPWNVSLPGAEGTRRDSLMRAMEYEASQRGESFNGSAAAHFITDADRRGFTVEGEHYPLNAADSTLVVLIQVPPDNAPRTITTTRIGLMTEQPTKTLWISGDTTFHLLKGGRTQRDFLIDMIKATPAGAVFLK